VFSVGGDPIKQGIVYSLTHPGGNATGTVLMTGDLDEKRFGILHDLVPDADLVGVLVNPNSPILEPILRGVEDAAKKTGQRIEVFRAGNETELTGKLAAIVERVRVLLVTADPFFDTQRPRILAALMQARIPGLYQFREYAVEGGLMSYGPSITENYRQFGIYVGRILKGEKPADLPVVRSTKFEFVLNLKTAKEIGVAIPPGLLAIADEVIE
jgi:putative ABC transport system substrate-binding protein